MTFGPMGAGSEFHRFSGLSGGGPELRERTSGGEDVYPILEKKIGLECDAWESAKAKRHILEEKIILECDVSGSAKAKRHILE